MIRLTLNETERRLQTQTPKTIGDRRLRHRCQAILMAAYGSCHGHIAEDLGVSGRTIQRWLNIYQAHGLNGLQSDGRQASHPRFPSPWPTRCGLDRANWTSAELAAHLYSTHGVAVSPSTMPHTCARRGVRPYRPTSLYLKGAPEAQARAVRRLRSSNSTLKQDSASRKAKKIDGRFFNLLCCKFNYF